jgi:hypothetical protein
MATVLALIIIVYSAPGAIYQPVRGGRGTPNPPTHIRCEHLFLKTNLLYGLYFSYSSRTSDYVFQLEANVLTVMRASKIKLLTFTLIY